MKRLFCLLLALLLLPIPDALAETIQFQQQPDGSTLGFVITMQDGLVGLQTTDGQELLPAIYKDISIQQESILVRDTDNRYGYLKPDGSWLIAPKYDYASRYTEGIAIVGRDFGYTLVDKTGAELIPLQPARVQPSMYDDYYTCSHDGKTTVWDLAGQQVAEIPYETTWFLDLSMFGVTADGKQGAASVDGLILPIQYDTVDVRRTGTKETDGYVIYANAGSEEWWFRADGTQIGDQTWENTGMSAISGTAIAVCRDGKYGLMDMDGNVILQPIYQDVFMVNGDDTNDADIVAVQRNGKIGLLKWDGTAYQEIVPPVWSNTIKPLYMRRMGDGTISVARVVDWGDGSTDLYYGLVSQDGRVLLEPIYTWVEWDDEQDKIIVHTDGDQQVVWAAEGESLPDTLLREEPVRTEALALQVMGILQGDANGDLRLWEDVTRAEFVTMLSRAENWDVRAQTAVSFSDTAGHWAAAAIELAVQKGLVQGYDGQFRPDDPVSYNEGFLIILRALGVPNVQLQGQLTLGGAAHAAGIDIYPTSYGSSWPLPREQAAKLIYDYLHTDKTAADVENYLFPVVEETE